jgi:aspartyl-tRNA(Asn)/glutamyl-tRNA(Gln) amidotransferase subunit C
MAITRDIVVHVAKLACLELSDAEITKMTSDLDSILGHVEELAKLDTTQVAPTTHLAVEHLGFNTDTAKPTLSTAQALAEAPRSQSNGFAVPAFVEET